ncbi:MAG: hypothetical protein ICV79_08000 [Flavisolibacter sp.]|nr:hypothetical protein [Flavisolibacter sp.]
MKSRNTKQTKQELDTALGTPKYFINTPDLIDGETYSWFPTCGDSMTNDTDKSIPSGSLVLGRWVKVNNVSEVPLHRPIVIIIDDNGRQHCMLKSGCSVRSIPAAQEADPDAEMLCLRSYNPAPQCADFWIPFSCIKFVFVVERVRRPDGSEFVPKQEEVVRKGST